MVIDMAKEGWSMQMAMCMLGYEKMIKNVIEPTMYKMAKEQ